MEIAITHIVGDISRNVYSHKDKKSENVKSFISPSSKFSYGTRMPLVDCLMLFHQYTVQKKDVYLQN